MCNLSSSSWLSRSIPMFLLVMSLSGVYSRLCPEGCTCLFNEYRCANGTVKIRKESYGYMRIFCMGINVTCNDLPKIDLQYTHFGMINCSASILTCLSNSLGLDVPSIVVLEITLPRGSLEAEYLKDFKYLQALDLDFADGISIPIALINAPKYLKGVAVSGGKLKLSKIRFNSTSLQNIHLYKTKMDRFKTALFNGLTNLKHLYLEGMEIENISVGFLKGLDSLERLTLHQNSLKFIEVGVFASTPKLKLLEIIYNPLLSLSDHLFDGLTSLQTLHIVVHEYYNNNNIVFQYSEIPIPVFSSSLIDNLPMNTQNGFDGNTIFSESIDESNTKWNGSRRPIKFTNLTSLKNLVLTNISISELSDVMFFNVPALETLYLKNNKIKELPKSVFNGLTALVDLNLSFNNIKILQDGIFSNLTALDVLNLSNNVIEKLTLNVFYGLSNLTQLNLRNNNIMYIEVANDEAFLNALSPFKNIANLRHMDLSNNKISRIGDALCFEMPHIRVINLANNRFNNIWEFYGIGSLKNITLNLSNNTISEIILQQDLPTILLSEFSNQSQTAQRFLDLEHNPIFCNCNNYDLFVCAKGITPICQLELFLGNSTCSGPSQLKGRIVIELSPSDFVCELPIVCPNNCTCIFRPATKEIILDCTEMPTKLPAIDNMLSDILSIEDYGNSYTLNLKTQTAISVDLNTNTLNISNTSLYNITFKPNDHLKILDISHNMLTTIPDAILISNITLYVAGNPLECDCALVEQLEEIRVADYRLVYCANGEALSNINVGRLCAWKTVLFGHICLALMAVIFILKVAITMYRYIKRKRLTISRFLFRRGSDFSINLERNLDIVKEYDLFISFAHQDTEFVRDNLLPKLENEFSQRVCVHHRDWVAGELIDDQIIQSVESSRRTIIILTEAFILSEWSYLEFRTAHNMSIREGRPRVIMILLEEAIVNDQRLSKEIKTYTSINTYLVWGDPDFWQKLKQILPKRHR